MSAKQQAGREKGKTNQRSQDKRPHAAMSKLATLRKSLKMVLLQWPARRVQ